MIDEYQKKYKIPSLTTDAVVIRKHKNDDLHDILLVTRGNYPEEGKLAFPGGFVEYGEDPQYGCLRELKEETELNGKDIELLTVRGNPKRDPRRHVVSIIYTVNVDPESQPKGGDDAKEAKFYDLKDIIENKKSQIAFDHYGVIEELIEKKFKGLYNVNKKNSGKLKSGNICKNSEDINNIDKSIKIFSEKIEKIELDESKELYDTVKKKKELEFYETFMDELYEKKLDFFRKKISEITSEKWQIFDEKVNKIREIKLKREKFEKKVEEIRKDLKEHPRKIINWISSGQNNFPYSRASLAQNAQNRIISEAKLKATQQQQPKKTISISTENEDKKINNNIIKEENINTVPVFTKVKNVLDTTIEKVKEVAKESINKDSNEENKKEQIKKIKKITNDAIDEINKLTKFIVEQSNDLIEKINKKDFNILIDGINFKEIKKEEELICGKCLKKLVYPYITNSDGQNCKVDEKHIVHKGVRCNGCGHIIWENV